MRRRLFVPIVGGAGLAAWSAATAPPHRAMTIAAMPPGTSWYVFAATLAQLLEPQLPGYSMEIFARGGGTGNPVLVERGKASIALCQTSVAMWAWDGLPPAFPGLRYRRIRALAGGLNSVWIVAVAREEYLRRTGLTTLAEVLRAQPAPRILMKPPGSTVPVVADMILDHYGLSRDAIAAAGGSVLQLAVNQIPEMLADGRADLYFESAIKGHPALTEAATTAGIRFLDFDEDLLASLARRGLTPGPMPIWFKGQTQPVKSVDCGTLLIARDDLPEDVAYLVTRTLCERRETMIEAHKAWVDFRPETAARREATGIPLHPGAERYFRERQWL
ncbi:MAG: TAXI family TRAP transporter solute-binding subunit [Bryobacteraceae bacterium]|nr:TAXI family TRAP transporter solute-binding subunit [Bryobacteraceae bacterium]